MKHAAVLSLVLLATSLDVVACQAADRCRGSKIYRACQSNASYALCNGDLMCQMQAQSVATYTCYSLRVPCSFDPSSLEDVLFAGFKYPIVGTQYDVPPELAH